MSWLMPFPEKTITGHYGTMSAYRRKHGLQPHSGTDFAPAGSNRGKTPIPAIAKGTIKLIQWSNVLGWVIVQTAMDKNRKVWYIGYCHVKCGTHGINCKGPKKSGCKAPIRKTVGYKLKAGETVAFMGNTGYASSGVHLHLTASRRLKGVFGVTSDKADIFKLIKTNKNASPKPKPAPVVPTPISVVKTATFTAKPETPFTSKPVATPVPKTVFHKVTSGETLTQIAAQYQTTINKLIKDNSIKDANLIRVGQMIRIEK